MSTNISCYRVFGLKLGKEKGIPVFWFPWHAHRLYDGLWENFGGCTLRDSGKDTFYG